MTAYKPWAYYFVVLFSRGMLRDPRFAQILLSTGCSRLAIDFVFALGFPFKIPQHGTFKKTHVHNQLFWDHLLCIAETGLCIGTSVSF